MYLLHLSILNKAVLLKNKSGCGKNTRMGNLFGFGSSNDSNRIRVNIKDLKTGRVIAIPVQKPFEVSPPIHPR